MQDIFLKKFSLSGSRVKQRQLWQFSAILSVRLLNILILKRLKYPFFMLAPNKIYDNFCFIKREQKRYFIGLHRRFSIYVSHIELEGFHNLNKKQNKQNKNPADFAKQCGFVLLRFQFSTISYAQTSTEQYKLYTGWGVFVLTIVAVVNLAGLAGLAGEAAVHDTAHSHPVPHLQNNKEKVQQYKGLTAEAAVHHIAHSHPVPHLQNNKGRVQPFKGLVAEAFVNESYNTRNRLFYLSSFP